MLMESVKRINPANITPQQISIFIAAAETENFTIAAERLGITQPLVSKTIASLEYEIGFPLFIRKNRKVRLTPAGRELLESWKNIYVFIWKSISQARQVDREVKSRFSIVYGRGLNNRKYVIQLLRKYSRAYPDIQIDIERVDMDYAVNAIETGLADIGLTVTGHLKKYLSSEAIQHKVLIELPTYATVPSSLPIYRYSSLKVEDLVDMPIMMCNWATDTGYNQDVLDFFNAANLQPTNVRYAFNADSMYLQAQLTGAVVLANPLSSDPMLDTRNIPVEGQNTGLVAFWNRHADPDKIKRFLDLTADYLKNDFILE